MRRVSMPSSFLKTPRTMMSNNVSEIELKDGSSGLENSNVVARKTSIFGPMVRSNRRSSTIFTNPDGRKLSASWSHKLMGNLTSFPAKIIPSLPLKVVEVAYGRCKTFQIN